MADDQRTVDWRTRAAKAWFEARAAGLRLRRGLRDLADPPPRLMRGAVDPDATVLAESVTSLWNGSRGTERRLTAGKVQNLRLAARRLDGLAIPAGAVFSFWRHVPRPTARRGYAPGRELREGCMTASIGGGLCQLSNALYDSALRAGCRIVERHAHSHRVPHSLSEQDRDATVFWNYVDLRFSSPVDLVVEARLTRDDLVVRLRAREAAAAAAPATVTPVVGATTAADCLACARTDCVNFIAEAEHHGRTAWLLDEVWPEFDAWMAARWGEDDVVHLPLDGGRRGRRNYDWSAAGARPVEHWPLALRRAWRSRRLADQGAARQRALLDFDDALAAACARRLPPDVERIVAPMSLLAGLHAAGALGGRRLTVLANRAPLDLLQEDLDRAARAEPDRASLVDYRADPTRVAREQAALDQADRIVTPHHDLARRLGERFQARIERLDWIIPTTTSSQGGEAVLFAGPSLPRRGVYEMRRAAAGLERPLRLTGRATEAAGFWSGLAVETARADPLSDVACVAAPAFVERRPGLLLRALGAGIPVVCTPACGLPAGPLVTLVAAGDAEGLAQALGGAIAGRSAPS